MGKLTRIITMESGSGLEISQGGIRIYTESQMDAIEDALVKFQQKSDTKAAVVVLLFYASGEVCQGPAKAKSLLVQTDH